VRHGHRRRRSAGDQIDEARLAEPPRDEPGQGREGAQEIAGIVEDAPGLEDQLQALAVGEPDRRDERERRRADQGVGEGR
jgi:hypothetical protein